MAKLTPAMQQYMDIKSKYPDCIIFFRMGDFYETFFDDAKITSKTLDIVLTKRGIKNTQQKIPLAGIPYHALDSYLSKMVKAGYKVAIVEQLEDPKLAKGVVKRGVIRIVTPGTVVEHNMLGKNNNFIMSLAMSQNGYGISFLDISTGEFITSQLSNFDDVLSETSKYSPAEILLPESFKENDLIKKLSETGIFLNFFPDINFYINTAESALKKHFNVLTLEGFGLMQLSTSSSGALLNYVYETQKTSLEHINKLRSYDISQYMVLDNISIKNLELVKNIIDNTPNGTLLGILDRTVTPMGARRIKQILQRPLKNVDKIKERLSAVEELFNKSFTRGDLRDQLAKIADIERIISRINYGNANPRDLIALKNSLNLVPEIKKLLETANTSLLTKLSQVKELKNAVELIDKSITEEPPVTITEGNIIKRGFNKELDELKQTSKNAKYFIKELERTEKVKTGIKSLKIGFNKVFGYYIEVTKPNLQYVPEHYTKKQTLVNSERFITQELKEKESLILGAEEKINALEQKLFNEIIQEISKYTKEIQKTAYSTAYIDVLCSFAEAAVKNKYVKPEIKDDFDIEIIEGRHPVVEQTLPFVPNDIMLTKENRMMIITGPNMSGKSTYQRQVALIVLMAQAGSFVPATKASISVVDRIFTRVGAFDDIYRGQSTFMVEMTQTANILNNATEKSLVILDELGRGTSTYDGVSIAWAVAEYIAKNLKSKALFATHYHILNQLEKETKGVRNYNIAVKEKDNEIVFLRKIIPGGTDKSYGIHVAKLAGMPNDVIKRSRELQFKLENEDEISEKIVVETKKQEVKEDKEEYVLKKSKQAKLTEM
ncbi:DNA mismatch repair protein MutS [Candidatus Woesearchaeota archaeon]|nr:DNA mismatch repair protein MutS [Candidatus Woesearchaeota archaeon]